MQAFRYTYKPGYSRNGSPVAEVSLSFESQNANTALDRAVWILKRLISMRVIIDEHRLEMGFEKETTVKEFLVMETIMCESTKRR